MCSMWKIVVHIEQQSGANVDLSDCATCFLEMKPNWSIAHPQWIPKHAS